MAQIEVGKSVAFTVIGAPDATVGVSKVVAYVIMVPGEDSGGSSNRQGHVHGEITHRIRPGR